MIGNLVQHTPEQPWPGAVLEHKTIASKCSVRFWPFIFGFPGEMRRILKPDVRKELQFCTYNVSLVNLI